VECLDKKSLIERIAFDLFLRVGYDATSIRMICKAAQIDPPTLYNFFGSKKGLFFAVANSLRDQFVVENDSYNLLLNSLPPEMQLYSIFSTRINFALAHIQETKFFFRYSLFCPEELQAEVAEFINAMHVAKYKLVDEIVHACVQQKLIGVDIKHAAPIFWKFVNNHTFSAAFEDWKPSKEELLELWKTFFTCRLKGITS